MNQLRTLFLGLLLLLATTACAAVTEKARPNILFIAIDDMKPLTGTYGSETVMTPSLDALANQSVTFTQAYAQYPVCGGSRASLMTGVRPETNGVLDLKTRIRDVNPDVLTLPQHFRNNGYETAAAGKIFDPRNVESRSREDPQSWSIPYKKPMGGVDKKRGSKLAVKAIDAPGDQFVDGNINNRGIKLLQKMAAGSKPFFLAVGYKKPHLPFVVPKKYFDLYQRKAFALESFQQAPAQSDASYIMNNNSEIRGYRPTPSSGSKVKPYGKTFTPEQQRELIHGYHAAASFIDSLLGNLLKELEAIGKADNTIVVLWGDHGFHLGDHGLWGKHTTMEQAARVPMIIHVPGKKGGLAATPVELMDLFPTLAELAGLPVPAHLQGKSLVPVLEDTSVVLNGVAITQYKRNGAYGYSMRTDRYRYTEWVKPDGSVSYRDLYDLQEDPGETLNIGKLPQNKSLMDSLAKQLRQNKTGLMRLN